VIKIYTWEDVKKFVAADLKARGEFNPDLEDGTAELHVNGRHISSGHIEIRCTVEKKVEPYKPGDWMRDDEDDHRKAA
jgi:hypothetical protein